VSESVSAFDHPILHDAGPLESEPFVRRLAAICEDAKAVDIQALRVLELVQYTDWFLVCTGRSDRHVRAIHDALREELGKERIRPLSAEGIEAGQWVCCDYESVVVHIFYEPVRDFYALERLWSDAPRLELKKPAGRA
jgi:ribosome-associated protein